MKSFQVIKVEKLIKIVYNDNQERKKEEILIEIKSLELKSRNIVKISVLAY
jgi:hypothetical protein